MEEKALSLHYFKKKNQKKIINIHIQNPKIALKHFDFIVALNTTILKGPNVLNSKGAIHYLTNEEINNSKDYLRK